MKNFKVLVESYVIIDAISETSVISPEVFVCWADEEAFEEILMVEGVSLCRQVEKNKYLVKVDKRYPIAMVMKNVEEELLNNTEKGN